MPVRSSEATWEGNLRGGSGSMTIGDGVYQGAYTFASRFQEGEGTNPEELIAAAHAGCFAMALANGLAEAGFDPQRVHATASVHLEDGTITKSVLEVEATIPDISETEFLEAVAEAEVNCPVSQALDIEIEAHGTLL